MKKTIGILGGMGPEASSYFYDLLIHLAHDKYGAVQDSDFPPTIIYNLPLEGFDERGIVDEDLVSKQLDSGVQLLERAGSDLIIIACNTVHTFHETLQLSVQIPILNIVEETVNAVLQAEHHKVGVIGSQSTRELELYTKACEQAGLATLSVSDTQQIRLNDIILHVMAGENGKPDTEALREIINDLVTQGAEAVILGCTELPLAITQKDVDVPLFNSNEIILNKALEIAFA